MGTVWRAEQEFPVKREVAIKVIRREKGARKLIDRFEAERLTLAMLTHPAIVGLYEVGETEEGTPFFAMELVKGEELIGFCDSNRLSIRDRLTLLLQITRAVQHAHQRGIIHRDLKPGNILVSIDEDGSFAPKLIDFGIAKPLSDESHPRMMTTLDGEILGTPQYMSPEQAGGGEIETRTDIFGLGVILFELITGGTPLSSELIARSNMETVLRLIREREAERPSNWVASLNEAALEEGARCRSTTPDRWRRQLRDELDWIVLKCLEKSPSRRYDSAGSFANDLQNYLGDSTVLARPPSRSYRMKKVVRRHKFLVSSLVSVFMILVISTSISLYWAVAATKAEKLARSRLVQADAIPEFLFRAFRQAAPENGGANMLAVDVLRQAEKDVSVEFRDQPLLRARIQESISKTYRDLGRHDLAVIVLEEAIESLRTIPGNEEAIVRLSFLLSGSSRNSGWAEPAIRLSKSVWRERENRLGPDHPATHKARLDYCRNLLETAFWEKNQDVRGKYLEEVKNSLDVVLNHPVRFPGADPRSYRAVKAQLAVVRGDHESALSFWDQEIGRRFLEGKTEQKSHYWPCSFLVAALRRTGRLEEAAAAAEILYLHCRDFYGTNHSNTTTAVYYLARVYEHLGISSSALLVSRLPTLSNVPPNSVFAMNIVKLDRWSEELQVSQTTRQSVSTWIALFQESTGKMKKMASLPESVSPEALFWLGETAWASGDEETALEALRVAYEGSEEAYGARHAITLVRGNHYAERCVLTGDVETALGILAPQIEEGVPSWQNTNLLDLILDCAESLEGDQFLEMQESIARQVLDIHVETKGENPGRMDRCYWILNSCIEKKSDFREQAQFNESVWSDFCRVLGPDHRSTRRKKLRQFDCLISSGAAREVIRRIEDFLEAQEQPDEEEFIFWRITHARALVRLKQYTEAEALLLRDWKTCDRMGSDGSQPPGRARAAAIRVSDLLVRLYTEWNKPDERMRWEQVFRRIQSSQ